MRDRTLVGRLHVKCLLLLSAALMPAAARAQQQPPPADAAEPEQTEAAAEAGDDIVVTGIRRSLREAVEIKRNAPQIVDAISAEDIGKLPDINVAEALQRVTGVQITRAFGEGSAVNIRGLSNVRVELNGRSNLGISIGPTGFDASGRSSGLEQLSSALFSTLEVKKTPTADQIEGGLGGVINLRTPQAFDFDRTTIAGSVEGNYGDLSDRFGYGGSALFATRFLDDRLGVLLNASYSKRYIVSNQFNRNNFRPLPNVVVGGVSTRVDADGDGAADLRPDRLNAEIFGVERTRLGISGDIDFQLAPELLLSIDGSYSELGTLRDQSIFRTVLADTPFSGAVLEGNRIVAGTQTRPIDLGAIARDEPSKTIVGGAQAVWSRDGKRISAEVSYSRGELFQRQASYVIQSRTPVAVAFDLRTGDVPSVAPPAGFSLTDLNNFASFSVGNTQLSVVNDELAVRLDGEFEVRLGPITKILVGARASDLGATQISFQSNLPAATTPAIGTLPPDFFGLNPYDTFSNTRGSFPASFVRPFPFAGGRGGENPLLARITPIAEDPGRNYDITEKVAAAYVRFDASGELGAIPYAANFGIRYVDTRLTTRTNRRVVAGTVTSFTPQTDRNEDTDWLPSMNLSFDLTQKLKLRFAAAKALARPNLPDLAPSVFVNQPGRAVSGGNAALESIKLDEYGAALEYYFGAGNIASATLFYKDVKGLIAPLTVVEIFPGFEFLGPVPITRPINTNNAVIKGIEVGYQQALDFLPDPLKGFGVIANLTYADGSTGTDEPIINLSEVSYNLIGYYERGGFSTRLAYNYRSRRAVSFTGADRRPDFIAPTSQLDASMSYNLNDNVSINFGAVNLIPSKSDVTSYNVVRNAVNAYELNERQFYLSLRARY